MKKELVNEISNISERMKEVRKRLGLTMDRMADSMGFSKSIISEVESGKKKPPFVYILGLYHEFNVNIMYLFSGEGEMFLENQVRLDKLPPEIHQMVSMMEKVPAVKYAMLLHFSEYRQRNKDIIEKTLQENQENK